MTEYNGAERSSATAELRRLLDERGVKWEDASPAPSMKQWKTSFTSFTGEEVSLGCYEEPKWIMGTIVFHTPEQAIEATLGTEINGETSDGYHTFNELYHHRAVLFSVIVENYRDAAWKAKKHHDGTMYDGMFIVGIDTPWGQASYHYDLNPYWDMFDCEEREAAPEWDGHTPDDAIERIGKLATLGGNGYKQAAAYWKRMFEGLLTERIGEERDDAATPSKEECKASKQRSMDGKVRGWQCHGCGAAIVTAPSDEEWPELPNYCPWCGKKVAS